VLLRVVLIFDFSLLVWEDFVPPRPKPYGSRPPPERRGRLWWIFQGPGHFMIWWRYHWPGHGRVQATWRRFNNPHVEMLYSVLFYAVLFLLVGIIIYFNWPVAA